MAFGQEEDPYEKRIVEKKAFDPLAPNAREIKKQALVGVPEVTTKAYQELQRLHREALHEIQKRDRVISSLREQLEEKDRLNRQARRALEKLLPENQHDTKPRPDA